MANKMEKKELYFDELSKQIDFSKNVHELNTNDVRILEHAAKQYGYRCKDNGSQIGCILHARFYCMLQNVYYKKLKENK